jgi:nucleoid-associated protein YgaU
MNAQSHAARTQPTRHTAARSSCRPLRLRVVFLVLIGLAGSAGAAAAVGPDAGLVRGADADAPKAPDAPDAAADRIAQLEALYQSSEQERQRLSRENTKLAERLRQTEAFKTLSRQVEKQTALLARLADKLGLGSESTDASEGLGAGRPALVDENARLRAELEVSERRLGLLMEQFAQAHKLRLDALADAAVAREQNAELDARLRQRRQAADEALMRADKAEKLYAALEEDHMRVTTENERLMRDLATARERQAQAMQRVVELDSLLAGSEAQAVQISASSDPPMAGVDDFDASARGPSNAGGARAGTLAPVLYQVRADDTLSRISAVVYGDASAWPRIFEANRDQLTTPDDLVLGMHLIIP